MPYQPDAADGFSWRNGDYHPCRQYGSISYKQVADLASDKALADYPNVYSDPGPWKSRIVALLDQYGDEPMSELRSETPAPNRDFGRAGENSWVNRVLMAP